MHCTSSVLSKVGARVVVLSPTRELALQTMKFTKEVRGVCVCVCVVMCVGGYGCLCVHTCVYGGVVVCYTVPVEVGVSK